MAINALRLIVHPHALLLSMKYQRAHLQYRQESWRILANVASDRKSLVNLDLSISFGVGQN